MIIDNRDLKIIKIITITLIEIEDQHLEEELIETTLFR
jgi:hypothetical protein